MIKKISIYFLILNIFSLFINFSSAIADEVQTVEIKLLKQKDSVEISFIAKNKINFDIISEKNQLKVISYSPLKFTYTPELTDDLSSNNQIDLQIDENLQAFALKGTIFSNLTASQIEKKLNGFSYSFKNDATIQAQDPNTVPVKKEFFTVKGQQWYFNFSDKTASAVFFRENFLWVVFNEYKKFEITPEVLSLDTNIKNIIQIPSQYETILRFELFAAKNVAIKKEVTSWILDWKTSNNEASNRQAITQYLSPNAKGVFFPIDGYVQKIIEVLDPDMQDTLKIIMSETENQGVDYDRTFADFKLDKTIQGVLMNILNDRAYIDLRDNGIEIILPPERIIKKDTSIFEFFSSDKTNSSSSNEEQFNSHNTSLLKFSVPNDLHFRRDYIKIFDQNIKVTNIDRFIALAKFYFMHQQYKECAGVINKIFPDVKDQELLLQGVVANYYVDNFEAADILLKSLIPLNANKNQEELNFWQNLIQFSLAKPSSTINFLAYEKQFLRDYPNQIRSKIAIMEIEDWLEKNKNLDQALKLLEILENEAYKRSNLAYIKYLKGKYYAKKKDNKKAIKIWNDLSISYNPKAQMLATFSLVECFLAEYKISNYEAIERLMHARFMWRGGQEEYKILRRVKELYIQVGDKVAALYIIKLMLEYDLPNNNHFYLIAELSKLLTDIFLHDEDLKDIIVITLFYEFKEMLPIGTLGDEIILGIVKRMINLDMIDKATAILEHQMKFRQNEANKVLIGIDLAEVYLLDNQPEKALNTLLEIKNIKVAEELQKKQNYILARVYFVLGKYKQVKRILENDFSHEANEILIDTYFKEQQWQALQIILELEVFQMKFEKDISEKSKNYIEKLLFCYYIQGQTSAIEELRKMLEKNGLSNQYDAFRLLTEFLQRDLVSLDAKSIKEYLSLDKLKLFLNSYKDYIKLPIKQS